MYQYIERGTLAIADGKINVQNYSTVLDVHAERNEDLQVMQVTQPRYEVGVMDADSLKMG